MTPDELEAALELAEDAVPPLTDDEDAEFLRRRLAEFTALSSEGAPPCR